MKKAFLSITCASILVGCTSADVLRHPGDVAKTSKYAPQNEKKADNNIGVMRYLNEGASFVREARREDAYKKMFNMCDSKYEILAETSSETSPMILTTETNIGFMSQAVSSSYRYIHFKCV